MLRTHFHTKILQSWMLLFWYFFETLHLKIQCKGSPLPDIGYWFLHSLHFGSDLHIVVAPGIHPAASSSSLLHILCMAGTWKGKEIICRLHSKWCLGNIVHTLIFVTFPCPDMHRHESNKMQVFKIVVLSNLPIPFSNVSNNNNKFIFPELSN